MTTLHILTYYHIVQEELDRVVLVLVDAVSEYCYYGNICVIRIMKWLRNLCFHLVSLKFQVKKGNMFPW